MTEETPPLRHLVGHITVDSGTVVIGDPCYLMTEESFDAVDQKLKYKPLSNPKMWPPEQDQSMGEGFGIFDPQEIEPGFVISRSQWGDGDYPVYVEYNAQGEMLSLTVRFDEEDDEAE